MKAIYIFMLTAFLTACGGNNSSSSNPNPASSSSSQSNIDPNSCDAANGVIFAECVNAHYGKAWGASYSPTWEPYETSQPGNQVQWAIVDSDAAHNKVMEVSFANNDKRGIFIIGSDAKTRDLSDYKGGKFSFDVKVVDSGEVANPVTGWIELNVRQECVYPCAAHYSQVNIHASNVWAHMEIPVKDLIASGLDITKISNSLQFSTRTGIQKGLRLQFDNIKFTKGSNLLVEPKTLYKEDYNSQEIKNWSAVITSGNPEVHMWSDVGAVLSLDWRTTNDAVDWETTLPATIDLTNKKISYQMFCAKESTDNFAVTLVATDENGTVAMADSYAGWQFPDDTWVYLNFSPGTNFLTGFNPKKVAKLGLRFAAFSAPTYTFCWVDTIRVTE